jgi:hypothetical protein
VTIHRYFFVQISRIIFSICCRISIEQTFHDLPKILHRRSCTDEQLKSALIIQVIMTGTLLHSMRMIILVHNTVFFIWILSTALEECYSVVEENLSRR